MESRTDNLFSKSVGAIVFDFDDTLLATSQTRKEILIKAAKHFGYELSVNDIKRSWGEPFDKLIANLLPNIDYCKFLKHYSNLMHLMPPKVLPGAEDLLYACYNQGVYVFVLSSGSEVLIQQDLEDCNLWRYISRLWGFESTKYHKPDPHVLDPLLIYLNRLKIKDVLYVGDSVKDLEVAKAKGMAFIAVLTGDSKESDFSTCGLGKNYIVDTLADIKLSDKYLLIKNDAQHKSS